jgi:PAS domain S-box-containing protein
MEKAMQQHEQAFRAMAENTPDTIVRYDPNGRQIYANPSYIRFQGSNDIHNRSIEETKAISASAEGYQKAINEVIETGSEVEYTLRWYSSEDRIRWSQIRIIPELDAQGSITSVLAIGRDISELMETERRQRESQKLLRKLLMHQEERYDARQKWAAWEVYDSLGQLLMVQRMDIGMLQRNAINDDAARKEHLEKMQAVTDQAIAIVRSVSSELRPPVFNMGIPLALEWIVEEFSNKTGISCELALVEDNIQLDDSHTNMLFHIVQNALENIFNHANARHVSVSLQHDNGNYVLKVRDDHMKIDLNTPHEGNLGLYYIQERVRAAGGKVVLISQDTTGTVLEVQFREHYMIDNL